MAEISVGGQPADVTLPPGRPARIRQQPPGRQRVGDRSRQPKGAANPSGRRRASRRADRQDAAATCTSSTPPRTIFRSSTRRLSRRSRRLSASRSPWSLALSPDGSTILVTNTLSRFVKFRTPSDVRSHGDRYGKGSRRGPVDSRGARTWFRASAGIPAASSRWSR